MSETFFAQPFFKTFHSLVRKHLDIMRRIHASFELPWHRPWHFPLSIQNGPAQSGTWLHTRTDRLTVRPFFEPIWKYPDGSVDRSSLPLPCEIPIRWIWAEEARCFGWFFRGRIVQALFASSLNNFNSSPRGTLFRYLKRKLKFLMGGGCWVGPEELRVKMSGLKNRNKLSGKR
jgi:hypothetical protein